MEACLLWMARIKTGRSEIFFDALVSGKREWNKTVFLYGNLFKKVVHYSLYDFGS